jgi:hypothetical protein
MLNPALLAPIVRAQLDGILKGNAPDGFILREKTADRIVLGPTSLEPFEGVEVTSVNVTVRYKGVDIVLAT